MNPIKHVCDRMGRNICKLNDVALDDLVHALVDDWNNLEPRFLRKLVQGMPQRVQSYTSVEEDTPVIDVNF